MNPTEFLLERIADDGATDMEMGHRSGCLAFGGWPGDPDSYVECSCGVHDRAMLECESKRTIAKLHVRKLDIEGCDTCHAEFEVTAMDYPCPTIKALLTIYADHPDFRDEWDV